MNHEQVIPTRDNDSTAGRDNADHDETASPGGAAQASHPAQPAQPPNVDLILHRVRKLVFRKETMFLVGASVGMALLTFMRQTKGCPFISRFGLRAGTVGCNFMVNRYTPAIGVCRRQDMFMAAAFGAVVALGTLAALTKGDTVGSWFTLYGLAQYLDTLSNVALFRALEAMIALR